MGDSRGREDSMGEGTGAGSETSGSAGKRMGDSRGTADSGGQDLQEEALLLMIHILCILSCHYCYYLTPPFPHCCGCRHL